MAVSAGERGARVDRRLLREARSARVPLVVAIVLGVLTAGLVVAQAILLGRIVARAFPGGEGLADVQGPLVALACVIAARAVCAAGFEASGRLGAGRVMSRAARAPRRCTSCAPARAGCASSAPATS